MKTLFHSFLVGTLIIADSTLAQNPSLQIESFKVEQVALSDGQRPWTQLICTVNNGGNWADGISFNYDVLAQPPSNPKAGTVLNGGITYSNVPPGKSEAIMYISPNATARYGVPIAATVQIDRGERTIQNFQWTGKSSAGADWGSKLPAKNDALLNIRNTPWITLDFDRSGDLLLN